MHNVVEGYGMRMNTNSKETKVIRKNALPVHSTHITARVYSALNNLNDITATPCWCVFDYLVMLSCLHGLVELVIFNTSTSIINVYRFILHERATRAVIDYYKSAYDVNVLCNWSRLCLKI